MEMNRKKGQKVFDFDFYQNGTKLSCFKKIDYSYSTITKNKNKYIKYIFLNIKKKIFLGKTSQK